MRDSGLADRFCAWSGGAERRSIFSVFPLRPDDGVEAVPLKGGGVMLGVQRDADGARRVLWSVALVPGEVPEGVAAALAALAARGGEIHLHLLAVGGAARDRIVAELGFPRLAVARCGAADPQSASTASGASMNPPDWRRQRSA